MVARDNDAKGARYFLLKAQRHGGSQNALLGAAAGGLQNELLGGHAPPSSRETKFALTRG